MDVSDALLGRRRRLWACGSLLVVGAGVVAYRSYSGKEAVPGWSYVSRVRSALRRYSEAFLMGSEVSSLLLRDLQTFLASDTRELPQSFKQLLHLAESQEVQQSTSHIVAAAVKGVMEGSSSSDSGSGDFLEKLIAAFSSDKGSNLLTLAISVACRSSTTAWCEHQARQDAASAEAGQPDMLQRLFAFAGTREGQQLTQRSICAFVREGTEVYMDKLEGTNSWADMLEAVSRPGNGAVADRLTRVFVREMVTAYFRRPRETETSSSRMEEVDDAQPPQQAAMHGSASPVDVQCQVSSLTAMNGEAVMMSSSKGVAVPLVADATGSTASQPEAAQQQQHHSMARYRPEKQQSSSNEWAKEVIQVVSVPEARTVLVTLAATASAQGVRGAFLALRDILLGEGSSTTGEMNAALRMPMQRLYVLVGIMFLVVFFFATRQAVSLAVPISA